MWHGTHMQAGAEGVSRDAQHAAEGDGVAQEREVRKGTEQGSGEQQLAETSGRDRLGAPSAAAPADQQSSSRESAPPQQVLCVACAPCVLLPCMPAACCGPSSLLSYYMYCKTAAFHCGSLWPLIYFGLAELAVQSLQDFSGCREWSRSDMLHWCPMSAGGTGEMAL